MIDVGFNESLVAKGLYRFFREADGERTFEGILGTHVDDVLMGGSDWFESNIEPLVKKRFHYGAEEEGEFTHLGLHVRQHDNYEITIGQKEYAKGLMRTMWTPSGVQSLTCTLPLPRSRRCRQAQGRSLGW